MSVVVVYWAHFLGKALIATCYAGQLGTNVLLDLSVLEYAHLRVTQPYPSTQSCRGSAVAQIDLQLEPVVAEDVDAVAAIIGAVAVAGIVGIAVVIEVEFDLEIAGAG